jgi:hypothetical protein
MNHWSLVKLQIDLRAFARACAEPWLWSKDMGGRLSWKKPRVFRITYPQLGDHWVCLCHLVRFRRASGMAHRLNLSQEPGKAGENRLRLVQEIADILQIRSELEFSDEPSELELPVHPARNGRTLLFPGCLQTPRTVVTYQFDGISHPHLNPGADEVASFLDCFQKAELRKIGRPLTLTESMDTLAQAKVFIGVSSGMSHLAASANTPALIYLKPGPGAKLDIPVYRHLKRWNPYPKTRYFSNVMELKKMLHHFI